MFRSDLHLDGLAIIISAEGPGADIVITWENEEAMCLSPANALLIAYAIITATDDHD